MTGTWVERHSGTVFEVSSEGQTISKAFDLSEVPVYVKGGAVIAEKPCCDHIIGGAMQQVRKFVFIIL
jgi:alpha-glucosidase (family GH31 glycosyl hydrolase)